MPSTTESPIEKEPAYILLSSKGPRDHIPAADTEYKEHNHPFPPKSLLFSPLYFGKDSKSINKSSVPTSLNQPNVMDLQHYKGVSHVFTESEYKEIVAYYNICGLNAWKIVAELPKFQERGTHVIDLCERLEEYKMGQWTKNVDQLKALVDEIKDWSSSSSTNQISETERIPKSAGGAESSQIFLEGTSLDGHKQAKEQDTENSKKKQGSFVINEEYEAMLTHFENLKPGQRSPTSSSSGYGSASSVRSRSSWSTDPNEFPFAYPTVSTLAHKRKHDVSPAPRSPHSSSPIGSRFKEVSATMESTRSRTTDSRSPLPSSGRYRLWPSSKGKKKPSKKSIVNSFMFQ